jgi:hypothetical protein
MLEAPAKGMNIKNHIGVELSKWAGLMALIWVGPGDLKSR